MLESVFDPFAGTVRPPDGGPAPPAMRWLRRSAQAHITVWAIGLALSILGDPDSDEVAGLGGALVAVFAVLGAAAWAAFRWIRPGVEVTPTSRLARILSLAWKGLLAAAVSAAIGKSIELLIG